MRILIQEKARTLGKTLNVATQSPEPLFSAEEMDTRIELVLNAVRNGLVDDLIIALAGQLIDEGVVEEKYQWVIGCAAAANGDPNPKMRQGVNEILQMALDFSEGRMDSVSRNS